MTTDSTLPQLRFSAMGERALLCQVDGDMRLTLQSRIWATARRISDWPLIIEAICGVNSLMVVYDAKRVDRLVVQERLVEHWNAIDSSEPAGKSVEIPVVYGGEDGSDLKGVAEICGLDVASVVERHSSATYTVMAIGADPGFAYLAGLDPALFVPRLAVPRVKIPKGSIIIAGGQAGIQPIEAPCGWHVLGKTDLSLFDPSVTPPALLQPGDQVTFKIKEFPHD